MILSSSFIVPFDLLVHEVDAIIFVSNWVLESNRSRMNTAEMQELRIFYCSKFQGNSSLSFSLYLNLSNKGG